VGWISRHGHRLTERDREGRLLCPESGWRYEEENGALRCLDWPEEAPLAGS
jgi:UDP-2-acetamido-3-amino-2,3-dideoxy-glucuronate N-acetyltransferase